MNVSLRFQQRNLDELAIIMKDDPIRILSAWKKFSPLITIKYYYDKSYVFDCVKVMSKIVVHSPFLYPHKEQFFFTITSTKPNPNIRQLMIDARREAAKDLVHCSKILDGDTAFQAYLRSTEFLFPPQTKRKERSESSSPKKKVKPFAVPINIVHENEIPNEKEHILDEEMCEMFGAMTV